MIQDEQISILLVEDHQLTRTGLKLTLGQCPAFRIVGDTSDGRSAVSMAVELRPQIVLMDIGLPGMDGIEATWQIKSTCPASRIIMLTSHESDEDIMAALGVGADGYCGKDASLEELTEAINAVSGGVSWLDPRIAQRVTKISNAGETERPPARKEESQDFLKSLALASDLKDSYGLDASIHHPPIIGSGDPFIGQCFADRYLIESFIGQGGMGKLYKARHLHMNRFVAIKILSPELAFDRKVIRRFEEESKAASVLSHPNVVTIFDFGVTEHGQPFLIMDYLKGETLDELLERKGNLDLILFLRIFIEVCAGLAVAHAKGVVHCDLKPSNIMLTTTEDGHELVKIVDFGLAVVLPKNTSIQNQLTDSYEVNGSPTYMSPEQCIGRKLDCRSDIYSLGCVMYEAITGKTAFNGDTPFECFSQHLTITPEPFAVAAPDKFIPAELESVIFTAFNKEPELRFQSIDHLRDVLEDLRVKNAFKRLHS